MILVDTSVWIDHLRDGDAILTGLLERAQVLGHPFVLGELATGSLRQRAVILHTMRRLPQAVIAHDTEVLDFIERETLFGIGLGYVDVHLLASVRLTAGALLLTRDKRLLVAAERMAVAAQIEGQKRPFVDKTARDVALSSRSGDGTCKNRGSGTT